MRSKPVSDCRIIRAVHLVRLMRGTEVHGGKTHRWWQTFLERVEKIGTPRRDGSLEKLRVKVKIDN